MSCAVRWLGKGPLFGKPAVASGMSRAPRDMRFRGRPLRDAWPRRQQAQSAAKRRVTAGRERGSDAADAVGIPVPLVGLLLGGLSAGERRGGRPRTSGEGPAPSRRSTPRGGPRGSARFVPSALAVRLSAGRASAALVREPALGPGAGPPGGAGQARSRAEPRSAPNGRAARALKAAATKTESLASTVMDHLHTQVSDQQEAWKVL